jgi:uncharacterized protein YlzI (FlbEa/FlbD family)
MGLRSKETLTLRIESDNADLTISIDDYLGLSKQLLTKHFLELHQVSYMLCLLLPTLEYKASTGKVLYCYIGAHSPIYSLGDFKRIYSVDHRGYPLTFTIEQSPEQAQKVYLKSESVTVLSRIISGYTEVSAYTNRSTVIANGNKAMVKACTEAIVEKQEVMDLQIEYQRQVKLLKQKQEIYKSFVESEGLSPFQINFLTQNAKIPSAPIDEEYNPIKEAQVFDRDCLYSSD